MGRIPRVQSSRPGAGAALLAGALLWGGAVGCVGDIGDRTGGGSQVDGPVLETEGLVPATPSLRRLLARQYVNAIRDLLGADAALVAAPPADTSINGFESIGAAQLAMGDDAVKAYEASARAVATAAMGNADNIDVLLGCTATGPADAACHEKFVTTFGRLAFRRPLADDEIASYAKVAQAAAASFGDFHAGVEYAIAAILQSPSFLYQVELGAPVEGSASFRKLTGLELASRMSFFLLDTTPTAELLDAAVAGELDDAEGARAVARAMLAKDGARSAIENLYSEVFRLGKLDDLTKDATLFPQFSPGLAQAMKQETLHLIDDIVWERDADFRELYTADYTFVDPELAALYGVDAPADGEWAKVTLPAEQGRAGLLGQASFLSLFAHVSTTSPTLRGKFVRERLLCQSIPAPPNNVNTTLPDNTDAKTMRDKLMQHQADPSCAGCHKLMDNIGLGFENFDPIGAYRATENDQPIDASGDLSGKSFDGVRELAQVLADDPSVLACIVRNVYRHSMGHVETSGEKPAITALSGAFEEGGGSLQGLLVELVASEAFRMVGVAP